jgi:hypothetical protein
MCVNQLTDIRKILNVVPFEDTPVLYFLIYQNM